jgi:hypothetical protein
MSKPSMLCTLKPIAYEPPQNKDLNTIIKAIQLHFETDNPCAHTALEA